MKFLQAVLILSGMIIGAGMFGIPFAFARAGFWLGTTELFLLTGIMVIFHLLYAEIVVNTKESHRLPGYVKQYLGMRAATLSWISAIFGISFALLVYIVLGSLFLNTVLGTITGSDQFGLAISIIVVGALINIFPLKKETFINGIFTVLLMVMLAFLIIRLLPLIQTENIRGFIPQEFFLPYGILLFALSGGTVVPELVSFLGKERSRIRSAIAMGTILPAFFYFFFALAVVGVSGTTTSAEALAGLLLSAEKSIIVLGSLVGFLAVFTSFVMLNSNFEALLRIDLKVPSKLAWFFASLIPAVLYLAGFQDFIKLISVVGALAVGTDAALVIASYHSLQRIRNAKFSAFSYVWKTCVFLLIAAGALYQLIG